MKQWIYAIGLCSCVGVMGCASSSQRVMQWKSSRSSGMAQSRSANIARQRSRPGLGTAYGRSVYAPVRFVRFVRATHQPRALLRLYYNDRMGIHSMLRVSRHSCCRPMRMRSSTGVSVWLTDPSVRSVFPGLRAHGRTFVVGQNGAPYAIALRNNSRKRYEVVLSVDGLDVTDGRRASVRKRGYILYPGRTLVVRGFRQSVRRVARFRFRSVSQSYAALKGKPRHIGVIGVALFAERTRERHSLHGESRYRLEARPFSVD